MALVSACNGKWFLHQLCKFVQMFMVERCSSPGTSDLDFHFPPLFLETRKVLLFLTYKKSSRMGIYASRFNLHPPVESDSTTLSCAVISLWLKLGCATHQ